MSFVMLRGNFETLTVLSNWGVWGISYDKKYIHSVRETFPIIQFEIFEQNYNTFFVATTPSDKIRKRIQYCQSEKSNNQLS